MNVHMYLSKLLFLPILCTFISKLCVEVSSTECVFFTFPTIINRHFIGTEGTEANISFVLEKHSCNNEDAVYIEVFRKKSRMCGYSYSLKNNLCYKKYPKAYCNCISAGVQVFSKTLDRSDNNVWQWIVSNRHLDKIAAAEITFNITYSSKIKRLLVNGNEGQDSYFIPRNTSLNVVCIWENGNPPTTARLLENGGTLLSHSGLSGNISHELPAIGCHDNIVIQCEAGHSVRNISAKLLILCPPKFRTSLNLLFTANVGDVVLPFQIQSYTINILECQVRHFQRHYNSDDDFVQIVIERLYQCIVHNKNSTLSYPVDHVTKKNDDKSPIFRQCLCSVNGTVPHISLTVLIGNATKHFSGNWTLMISNSEGSDEQNFTLQLNTVLPRVNNLTINGIQRSGPHVVLKNQNVHIVCSWKTAKPPEVFRLVGSNGELLKSNSGTNESKMDYQFTTVRCANAGIIRCEANRSERNMSTLLLVECPPEFSNTTHMFTQSADRRVSLNFPVRIHTLNITECQISRFYYGVSAAAFVSHICSFNSMKDVTFATEALSRMKCWCYLNGTVPDLYLNIQVRDMSQSDSGQWRATIVNDVGSGHVNYFLNVSGEYIDVDAADTTKLYVIPCVSVAIIVIASVTVIGIVKAKTCYQPNKGHLHFAIHNILDTSQQRSETFHHSLDEYHIYEEITDIPEDTGESMRTFNSVCGVLIIPEPPEDYLMPSLKDIETGSHSSTFVYLHPVSDADEENKMKNISNRELPDSIAFKETLASEKYIYLHPTSTIDTQLSTDTDKISSNRESS